ncbi:UNVERIFIED_CONTAM: hypothetical protein FKN15_057265 [Acipenser sinensis]
MIMTQAGLSETGRLGLCHSQARQLPALTKHWDSSAKDSSPPHYEKASHSYNSYQPLQSTGTPLQKTALHLTTRKHLAAQQLPALTKHWDSSAKDSSPPHYEKASRSSTATSPYKALGLLCKRQLSTSLRESISQLNSYQPLQSTGTPLQKTALHLTTRKHLAAQQLPALTKHWDSSAKDSSPPHYEKASRSSTATSPYKALGLLCKRQLSTSLRESISQLQQLPVLTKHWDSSAKDSSPPHYEKASRSSTATSPYKALGLLCNSTGVKQQASRHRWNYIMNVKHDRWTGRSATNTSRYSTFTHTHS